MTGFQIKLAAFIFMLFDHSACLFPEAVPKWFRLIGRFSFPAFAFMAGEGCRKTRSLEKYIIRLGLFALVCEIPYDLLFNEKISLTEDMNIIWTLLFGAVSVYILKLDTKMPYKILCILCLFAGLSFSDLDYGLYGVCLVSAYYLFENKAAVIASTVIIFTVKWILYIYPLSFYTAFWLFSCMGWLLPVLYNGKRGNEPKYFFYGAYFLHLIMFLCVKCVKVLI
ncbi:MAG: conjugal transfer protein TraX [Clostridiales bacterium]|nr:conjugal transfer protein TraX [Clostridiales bacterium]